MSNASNWPICFVASALGYPDVDRIYDKCVRPVLRELHLKPVRVDRIEHNDDIDDQISVLIHTCKLCIADLTYARPSVYYEAGVVHGLERPVVYMARSDHFRARDMDPEGNLRVHFDLQMKNVIPWKAADEKFRRRLFKRLKKVVRPLIVVQAQAAALQRDRTSFKELPIAKQLSTLRKAATAMLRRRGFSSKRRNFETQTTLFMERNIRHTRETVQFYPSERLTAKLIRDWERWSFIFDTSDDVTRHCIVLVAATLKPFSESTLRSALPGFRPVAPFVVQRQDLSARNAPRTTRVIVIPALKSEREFRNEFPQVLSNTIGSK